MSNRKRRTDKWEKLLVLVEDYAEAKVADSWKGGGDPASIPTIEAYLALAKAKLNEYIVVLKREEE